MSAFRKTIWYRNGKWWKRKNFAFMNQIKDFATTENFQKYKDDKQKESDDFKAILKNIGQDNSTLPIALEDAGASGIAISNWTGIMGANRVFGAKTKKIPTIEHFLLYIEHFRNIQ